MKSKPNRKIRIIQVLASLKYGDAIGNDCLAIYRMLKEAGYNTAIFAANIDSRIQDMRIKNIKLLDFYSNNADILICHIGYKWDYILKLDTLKGKKVFIWHNITPPHLLEEYGESESAADCRKGLKQIKQANLIPSLCLTPSEYNKKELSKLGYICPIHTIPILTDFKNKDSYNQDLITRYKNEEFVNILFVGRISPNKKQQDIIAAFYHYNRNINPKSRLFIVGNWNKYSIYCKLIKEYPETLGLNSVIFTGHVSDEQKASYYKLADVFLCMSEHEGFCVPLLEAMYYKVPIIACDSSAVTETLGGAGLIVRNRSVSVVAEAIDRLVKDKKLRDTLIANGTERLTDFSEEKVKSCLLKEISDLAQGT